MSDQRFETGDDVEQLLVEAALAQAVKVAREGSKQFVADGKDSTRSRAASTNNDECIAGSDEDRLGQIHPPAFAHHGGRQKPELVAGHRVDFERRNRQTELNALQMKSGDAPIVAKAKRKVRFVVERYQRGNRFAKLQSGRGDRRAIDSLYRIVYSGIDGEIMIIVLMGVSGAGKTTVGKRLATQLGWDFVEADDFHPPANIEKMHLGIPLDDVDRRPWLEALRQRVDDACLRGKPAVVACSALKQAYRDYLGQDYPGLLKYVYLHGSEELISSRLATRSGHFMNPNLLHSQFDTLESPADAIRVEVDRSPEEIAIEIRQILKL